MWTLPEAPAVIGSLASLLGGFAAVWGICVAHMGLETWRKQRDSDLSGRIAAEMFEYRKCLHAIRYPWVTIDEMERFPESAGKTEVDDLLRVARWQNSRLQQKTLERLIAEADIRWRGQAKPCYDEIVKMENDFAGSVLKLRTLNAQEAQNGELLRSEQISTDTWESRFDASSEDILRLSVVVSGSEDDETGTKLTLAFRPLEDLLRKMS